MGISLVVGWVGWGLCVVGGGWWVWERWERWEMDGKVGVYRRVRTWGGTRGGEERYMWLRGENSIFQLYYSSVSAVPFHVRELVDLILILCTTHNTTQDSTAQHSTAQHSTAQHSTAQHRARSKEGKSTERGSTLSRPRKYT